MRKSAIIGALLALGAAVSAPILDLTHIAKGPGAPRGRIQKRPKGYRNSWWGPIKNKPPFASTRQNARYARQIAAGQIRNASCVTW